MPTLRKSRAFDWNWRGFYDDPRLIEKVVEFQRLVSFVVNWVNFFGTERSSRKNFGQDFTILSEMISKEERFIITGKMMNVEHLYWRGEVISRVEAETLERTIEKSTKQRRLAPGIIEPIASGYGFPE